MENYIVKQEDLIGDIKGFPIEVVQKMIDYQIEQGNKANVKIFQYCRIANKFMGGFDSKNTKEGEQFWLFVSWYRFFWIYFEKYPKQEK